MYFYDNNSVISVPVLFSCVQNEKLTALKLVHGLGQYCTGITVHTCTVIIHFYSASAQLALY